MALVLVAQLLPVVTAGTAGWITFDSAGMEYLYNDEKVAYETASARCAEEGAMLASPNTEEANEFVYNLPSSDGKMHMSRFIGLRNTQGSCDETDIPFQWDTLVGYMEKPERWQADNTQKKGKPEPDNYRCKEFCVAVGDYRGIPNGGKWNTVKCKQKWSQHGYVCQRPLTVPVHELQNIALGLDNCEAKPRVAEPCMARVINDDPSCDLESLSIRKNGGKTGLIASATVREANPEQTALEMNGATPMQLSCIRAIGGALAQCASEQGAICPAPTASFAQYSSCFDGLKNGQEAGVDCGGNDCLVECTGREQPDRTGQAALSGGDPHYVAHLSHGINLCYDVHGAPGDVLNLISGHSLLVNSLVVAAQNSVSGTYHGAIGMVSLSNDGSGKRDTLAVLADGTINFNGDSILQQTLGNRTVTQHGATMQVEIVGTKSVKVSLETGPVFTVSFIESNTDHAHLDLGVDNARGLNGTQGIIGQFVQAPASVSPKDDKTNIVTVNGNTVEAVRRSMPQISGADADCFKYLDTQAEGILKGTFEDYRTSGIFQAPKSYNFFPVDMSFTGGVDVDSYVTETAAAERQHVAQTASHMRLALEKLTDGVVSDELAADELRNALISEVSTRLAYDVEELQGLSNEDILHRM